jgi:predicted metal-binding membrane protein
MTGNFLRVRHRRDQLIVLGGLAIITAGAWIYLLHGAGMGMPMKGMTGAMLMTPSWTLGYGLLMFIMWAVMMVAMMLPSAAPTILLAAAIARHRNGSEAEATTTAALFSAGYLLVWTGFSLIAMMLQWALDKAGLLSATMAAGNRFLAGTVLLAAGIYQWTPFKDTCLKHCRSVAGFLVQHWRPGAFGAISTGAHHGLLCLGCCWMLMALLFVGGVMNLLWIAALSVLVLLEKIMPWGHRMGQITGLLLIAWGAATVIWAI